MAIEEKNEAKALISWENAQILINDYETNHQIPRSDSDQTVLDSFHFPVGVMNNILGSGADKIYLAAAYHTTDKMYGASREGYTVIAFGAKKTGVDQNNKDIYSLMLGADDVIWDAIITDDYTLVKQNISLTNVKSIVKEYFDYHSVNTTFEDEDGNDITDKLKGLLFPNYEIGNLTASGYRASKIEFALAYHNTLANNSGQKGHTLIVLGNDSQGRMVNESAGHVLYDFCDPCPKKCPENVSQISN